MRRRSNPDRKYFRQWTDLAAADISVPDRKKNIVGGGQILQQQIFLFLFERKLIRQRADKDAAKVSAPVRRDKRFKILVH